MKRGIHKDGTTWGICYDGIALEAEEFLTLESAQLAWRAELRTGGEFYRDAATQTGMYDHDDSN